MSQQQKLEKVLELLINEDADKAAELLHSFIVEKARSIYESMVEEESEDSDHDELDEEADHDVGGEANKDFTDEIETDNDEIKADELMGGEAEEHEGDDEHSEEESEEDVECRVEDLESQLAELRTKFEALMGQELEEPQHADLGAEMTDISDEFGDTDDMHQDMMDSMSMYEKKKQEKLKNADAEKKAKAKSKKVEEETKFLNAAGDTGQKGTAKLVGTGKDTPLGAENDKSVFSKAPSKPSYGGEPVDFTKGQGEAYGKYHGDHATDHTPSNNVDVKGKKSSVKADTTTKFTGGKTASGENDKGPLTKSPRN